MSSQQAREDKAEGFNFTPTLPLEAEQPSEEYEEEDEDSNTPRQSGSPTLSATVPAPGDRGAGRSTSHSGSETEKELYSMSTRSSKHNSTSSSSSKKQSSSKSSKTKLSDDWSEVTEPEERRRIQNRIAQRKFREKARDHKERAEREARNQQHAGSAYRVPEPDELAAGEDLSGLPWGGMNIQHVVARGHNAASSQRSSQRGSRRESDGMLPVDDSLQYYSPPYGSGLDYDQAASYDGQDTGSTGDDKYFDAQSPLAYYGYDYDPGSAGSSSGR